MESFAACRVSGSCSHLHPVVGTVSAAPGDVTSCLVKPALPAHRFIAVSASPSCGNTVARVTNPKIHGRVLSSRTRGRGRLLADFEGAFSSSGGMVRIRVTFLDIRIIATP